MSCITDFLIGELRNKYDAEETALLKIGYGTVLCIEAFILFVAKTPAILTQFKTFLQGLIALIDVVVATVQLFITQLDVQAQILNAIIQPFRAFREQFKGQLLSYPFKEFDNCPPIAYMKELITKIPGLSKIPGMNKLKAIDDWFKTQEYRLLSMRNYIQELNASVGRLRASKKLFQTILDAIEHCFPS